MNKLHYVGIALVALGAIVILGAVLYGVWFEAHSTLAMKLALTGAVTAVAGFVAGFLSTADL